MSFRDHHWPTAHHFGVRLSELLIGHLPSLMVRETERVALSVIFITLGASNAVAIPDKDAHVGVLWHIMGTAGVLNWSVVMITAGVMVLVGMQRSYRDVERTGLALAALGCGVYGYALTTFHTLPADALATAFFFLCLTKVIRLAASTVGNARSGA